MTQPLEHITHDPWECEHCGVKCLAALVPVSCPECDGDFCSQDCFEAHPADECDERARDFERGEHENAIVDAELDRRMGR